jgi:ankyrin repeat protein
VLKELLRLGANPNQPDADKCTPLMYACRNGYEDTVRELLKHHGSVVCVDKTDMTAYMFAAAYGRAGALDVLLQYGNAMHLNHQDVNGRSVLHWAMTVKSIDCVKTLIKYHIEARCSVLYRCLHSRMPLDPTPACLKRRSV